MLKVCHVNPIPGGGRGIFSFHSEFCHKIDFSWSYLTFKFYRHLKHDKKSLRYVSRCFVEGR